MHEWMTDNNQTPLVVVDALAKGVIVPSEHVQDGRIVLNIAWAATRDLELGNDAISFQARFGGVAHSVSIPLDAVKGIYARESGQGMVFQDEPGLAENAGDRPGEADQDSYKDSDDSKPPKGGPNLRVVK